MDTNEYKFDRFMKIEDIDFHHYYGQVTYIADSKEYRHSCPFIDYGNFSLDEHLLSIHDSRKNE
jgi:hypothetical protein